MPFLSFRRAVAPLAVAAALSLAPDARAQSSISEIPRDPADKTLLAEPVPAEEGIERVWFFLPLFILAYLGFNKYRSRYYSRRDLSPRPAH